MERSSNKTRRFTKRRKRKIRKNKRERMGSKSESRGVKMSEFDLSSWVHEDFIDSNMNMVQDIWVQEFIKRLKLKVRNIPVPIGWDKNKLHGDFLEEINKLAGPKFAEINPTKPN